MSTQTSCAPSLNDVFAQPKRPAEFLRPRMQATGGSIKSEKQRKFLQLKEKIMCTDELIQKYRQKVGECEEYRQQLKEVQTKLSIEEKGRRGLVAELNTLHKKSESLQREKDVALEEVERLQLSLKEEQLVKEQLMVQYSELKVERESSDHLKVELSAAKSEMGKFKKMYQNLKQVYESYKAERMDAKRKRRASEAISLPTSLISPPLSFAALSPPLSTCSLPLPLTDSNTSSMTTELPIDVEQNSSHPSIIPEASASLFHPSTVKVEDDRSSLGFGTFDFSDAEKTRMSADNERCDDVIASNDKHSHTSGEGKIALAAIPSIRVSSLSDDSDSEGEEEERENGESMSRVNRHLPPKGKMELKQDAPICGDKKIFGITSLSDDSESEEEGESSAATSSVGHQSSATCKGKSNNVNQKCLNSSSDKSSPKQRLNLKLPDDDYTVPVHNDSVCQFSKAPAMTMPVLKQDNSESEEKRDLTAELFGDFDDGLSVSDSSSCCSRSSSLGSVDDLADLLLRSSSDLQGKNDLEEDKRRTCINEEAVNDSPVPVEEGGEGGGEVEMIKETGTMSGDDAGCIHTAEMSNATPVVTINDDPVPEVDTSLPQAPAEYDQPCEGKESSSSESDNGQLLTSGANSNTSAMLVIKDKVGEPNELRELDSLDVSNHHHLAAVPSLEVAASDVDTTTVATSSDEQPCNGPLVLLPKVEVEAAAADTASSDDSDYEMDVSFSTLFGDEFQVISPLPPSPLNPRIYVATPLSPLPLSPSKREFLSPLPQTPRPVLKPISPLPPSPINARRSPISPLSPSQPPMMQHLTPNEARCGSTSADSAKSEASSHEGDISPIQFDDSAPPNVCAPKPCCLSISVSAASTGSSCSDPIGPCATGSAGATPSPRNGKLRLSEGSPFSPLTFTLPSPSLAETSSVFELSPATTAPSTPSSAPGKTLTSSSSATKLPPSSEEAAAVAVFEALPLAECSKLASTTLSSESSSSSESRSEKFNTKNVVEMVDTKHRVKCEEEEEEGIHITKELVSESNLKKGDGCQSDSLESVERKVEAVQASDGGAELVKGSTESVEEDSLTEITKERQQSISEPTEPPCQVEKNEGVNKSDSECAVTAQNICTVSTALDSVVSDGISQEESTAPLEREMAVGRGTEAPLDGEVVIKESTAESKYSSRGRTRPIVSELTERSALLCNESAVDTAKGEAAGEEHTEESNHFSGECAGASELKKRSASVSSNNSVAAVESLTGKKVVLQKAVPLSSETGCHVRISPIEEGEISDSDDEEEERGGEEVVAAPREEIVAPVKVREEGEKSTSIFDHALLLLSAESSLSTNDPSLNSNQPPHLNPLSFPTSLSKPVPSIKCENKTSTSKQQPSSTCRSQKATRAVTETSFDSLLDTFCSTTKRRSQAKRATALVTNQTQGTPNPLTRLRSSVRGNRKTTGQVQKYNAAAIIGLSGTSGISNASNIESSCSANAAQIQSGRRKLDKPVYQVPGRINKAGKRLDNDSATASATETQLPASKRIKLEGETSSVESRRIEENTAVIAEKEVEATPVSMSNSPLVATSPHCLPGYRIQLRSRTIHNSGAELWSPRKRRSSSSSFLSSEESEHPASKKKRKSKARTLSSFEEVEEVSGGEKMDIDNNKATKCSKDGDVGIEDKFLKAEKVGTEQNKEVAGQLSSNTSVPFAVADVSPSLSGGQGDESKPPEKDQLDTTTRLSSPPCPSSRASLSIETPRPETTSVLAESCDLFGSDSGDSDESLVIGDLESLLDREEDKITPLLPPPPPPLGLPLPLAPTSIQSKPHVRKTDSATGQDEDQTPASSPKTGSDVITKQLSSLSEQKTTIASSTSVLTQPFSSALPPPPPAPQVLKVPPTSHGSEAVGYGQPLQAPLPKYTPSTSSSSTLKKTTPSHPNTGNPSMLDGGSLSCSDADIFHSPLPRCEKPRKNRQNSLAQQTELDRCLQERLGGAQISISLAQKELSACMQSPLPLPQWLVAAMTRVQGKLEHCTASGMALGKKKRGNASEPIKRQKTQKHMDYVLINLERLVSGHLHLSAVLSMFTDPKNVSSLQPFIDATVKFLQTRYNPKIEHVVSTFHSLCDDVRGNPRDMDPLDGHYPPALLRPECQLVALFLQMSQLSPIMAALLPEMNKTLYQLLVSRPLKFHKLSAFARILTAICRLQGDADRVLFLAFDLLKKPVSTNELPVFAAMASVWPLPLARKRGVKLVENRRVVLKGLEQQLLSYTLEVLVMNKLMSKEAKIHGKLSTNLHTLCHWMDGNDQKITTLTQSLMQLLTTSDAVYIVSPPKAAGASDSTPWHRPRPSVLAFHIVHCLRMISCDMGWVWTNDTLIRAHLWPLLQQWNAKRDSIREATIVCAVRLIGFISQQGLSHDMESSSVGQLQRVLVALLNKSDQVSFPVQLAAVDSLLELCPPSHPRTAELVGVVKAWLKQQTGKPHGSVLFQELSPRLQAFNV